MKSKLTARRVFALQGHTVKIENGKFYVAQTGSEKYSGPYKSLRHAPTAIARKHEKEFTERNAKLEAFHRVDKRKKVMA